MAYTKRRVRQHVMEDRSVRIVRDLLPEHWVIREYKPDYGIDLSVELFEFLDEEKTVAATLGETLFVQVKSTEVVDAARPRVHGRSNVERGPLREDRSQSAQIEVARLRLETSELLTVQAIGSAIPVLLFLVELSTRRIFFVCLNDLVEKVILPEDPAYHLKKTKVIHIPLGNCITAGNPVSVLPIGTYAKRAKLYAAFEKFGYQRNEAEFAWSRFDAADSDEARREAAGDLLQLIRHFLAVNLRYDFWTRMPEWAPIGRAHLELIALSEFLSDLEADEEIGSIREYLLNRPGHWMQEEFLLSLSLEDTRAHFHGQIVQIWRQLDNLSRTYEELVREWFLPTHLSTLLSQDLRES